jgi:hypothetical protein
MNLVDGAHRPAVHTHLIKAGGSSVTESTADVSDSSGPPARFDAKIVDGVFAAELIKERFRGGTPIVFSWRAAVDRSLAYGTADALVSGRTLSPHEFDVNDDVFSRRFGQTVIDTLRDVGW